MYVALDPSFPLPRFSLRALGEKIPFLLRLRDNVWVVYIVVCMNHFPDTAVHVHQAIVLFPYIILKDYAHGSGIHVDKQLLSFN